MRILIVSQYYYPEQFQINDIASGLVKKGHKVTVLCGLPNYPEGKVFKGYRFRKRCEIVDGVDVRRCFQFARGKGKVGLITNYLSFAVCGSAHVLFMRKQYDLVICYQLSPITMAYPALLYKRLTGKKMFLYCLDIFPESVLSHCSRDGKFFKVVHNISKKIYDACDLIGVTSKPFIHYLSSVNEISESKIVYLPQHAGTEMLSMDLRAVENGVVDFLFAGNIGFGQNLETLVNAVKTIKDKRFMVHLVGDGSRKGFLEQMVAEYGLENKFVFYGKKSREEMPDYYKKADVLVITLRGNNAVGNTMPGKLQMYMTTGKPIVGAINGAAREVIEDAKCGLCGPAEDSVILAKNMSYLIEHQNDFEELGNNARRYFQKSFTFEKCIDEWDKLVSAVEYKQ